MLWLTSCIYFNQITTISARIVWDGSNQNHRFGCFSIKQIIVCQKVTISLLSYCRNTQKPQKPEIDLKLYHNNIILDLKHEYDNKKKYKNFLAKITSSYRGAMTLFQRSPANICTPLNLHTFVRQRWKQ